MWSGRQPAGCVLLCLLGLLFYPEDGGDSSSEILFYFHWTISQKIEVLVVITVRISNPTEGKDVQL
jgi:hypothetical protein